MWWNWLQYIKQWTCTLCKRPGYRLLSCYAMYQLTVYMSCYAKDLVTEFLSCYAVDLDIPYLSFYAIYLDTEPICLVMQLSWWQIIFVKQWTWLDYLSHCAVEVVKVYKPCFAMDLVTDHLTCYAIDLDSLPVLLCNGPE